jgi:hypothetical protein
MMQLVINTFGASLKRKGDRFVVRAGSNQSAVSAHKAQGIIVTTTVHFSSDANALAIAHNIDVIFMDKFGEPIARVWLPRMGSTAAIRRRQLEATDQDPIGPPRTTFNTHPRELQHKTMQHVTRDFGTIARRRHKPAKKWMSSIFPCKKWMSSIFRENSSFH